MSWRDIAFVYSELYGNPLYAHLGLPIDFPSRPPTSLHFERLADRGVEFEAYSTIFRINFASQKLKDALLSLENINLLIRQNLFETATISITQHQNLYGESLTLLSKISLIFHYSENEAARTNLRSVLAKYGVADRNIVALSVFDTIGSQFEYNSLRRNIISYFSEDSYRPPSTADSKYGYDICHWNMYPYVWSPEDFARTLHSLSYASLTDSAVFLLSHITSPELTIANSIEPSIMNSIDPEIVDIWRQISQGTPCYIAVDDDNLFDDYYLYRQAVGWKELSSIRDTRLALDPFLVDPSDTHLMVPPELQGHANKYFVQASTLGDIAVAPKRIELLSSHFDPQSAGALTRTAAFVRLLRHGERLDKLTERQFVDLLNCTRSVAELTQSSEISKLTALNTDSLLYRYIICALMYDQSRRNIDRTRLANALQDIVIHEHGGNLIDFANRIFDSGKNIAVHFYELCSDEFLGLLFRIFDEPEAVSEARAAMNDWYADKFSEPIARDRAKAIRLNKRLQVKRGEINETRIFVDTLRFNQWIEENLFGQLAAAFSGLDESSPQIEIEQKLENFAERRTSEGQLASALEAAFHEFCTNARYGVNSYLGRRIRHGTLAGTMVSPIKKLLNNSLNPNLPTDSENLEAINRWMGRYEQKIRTLANEELQIQSKQKPKGLINASILDPEKAAIAQSVLKRIVAVNKDHRSIAVTAAQITELCWQLLETDLRRIRQKLQDHRTSWGRVTRSDFAVDTSSYSPQIVNQLATAINQTSDQQFATLNSWFHRPTSTTSSLKLDELIEVVIAETREHFPEFAPLISNTGDKNIEIYGGTYHHLYDVLSPIIENIAEHGINNGSIKINKKLSQVLEDRQKLQISITSNIHDGNKEKAKENVRAALNLDPALAQVQEGKSGLRKIKQMQSDLREISDLDICVTNKEFIVNFSFNLFLRIADVDPNC